MKVLELKSWYDNVYWSEIINLRPTYAYIRFIKYLAAKPGQRILDVGCGGGKLLKLAQERGLYAFGIELSSSGAKLAKSFAPGAYVIVGNGERLPFADVSFDYLTCLGSLEHFLNVEAGVKEMVRVCKAGARICILVPNSFYLFDVIKVLKTGRRRHVTFQPQEKLASFGEWQDLLQTHGLKILAVYRDKEPLNTSFHNIFKDLHPIRIFNRFLEKILQMAMPLHLGYQFIFVCQKRRLYANSCLE